MRQIVQCFAFLAMFLCISSFILRINVVYAEDCGVEDEVRKIQCQIDELEKMKKLSEDATKPLEAQVKDLDTKINNARAGIVRAKAETVKLSEDIDKRETDLAKQYEILSLRVAEQYKKGRAFSPLLMIFSTNDATEITKDLAYRSSVKAQDNKLIHDIGGDISKLEHDKVKLENDQKTLAALQIKLDGQADFFKGEIAKARDYQKDLGGQIAQLSAKQQEIINAKSGGFTFSMGDGELADEYYASIKGFREAAPAGHFAVFSFGGYTHRNGMSQYGARARAESGQSVEDILKAYYPNATLKKDYPVMDTINVSGHGSMPFEGQYLHGIYEMPGGWHVNALKAQAIAARTYAIKHTRNGQSSICTTEACQVFRNSRKGGAWEQAVNDTKGWVLVDGGGNPVSTQYASTHGGFSNTSGWDTTDKAGGSTFIDKAYEKLGGSPWLYKAWWREGYSKSGATCGRNNPWLSPEEMADIVNAHVVLKNGSSEEANRVTPVSTSCWGGGNPYSKEELRDVASKYGGISAANSVSVVQGNGSTATVTINGVSMSGLEFKKAFNVRASGYMRIPQNGFAFFNVERK